MFIEQLDSTRLLITLEQDDLKTFELEPYSISLENEEVKSLLKQLLTLAAIKAGIAIKDKVLSIETLPYDSGCFLLVTIKPKEKRKTYRIKTEQTDALIKFNNTTDMLSTIKKLYDIADTSQTSALFEDGKSYYLYIKQKGAMSERSKIILDEFGEFCDTGTYSEHRLNEYCNPICKLDAIRTIGSKL